jgi:hypothetical protein
LPAPCGEGGLAPQGFVMDSLKFRSLFAVLMALLMAFLMSAVLTAVNTGVDAGFVGRWLHAFIVAWPIAIVAAFFCAPIARRWTMRLLAASTRNAGHPDG